MSVRVLVNPGPFPHYLEWRMRRTEFLYDGLRLDLRCATCGNHYGSAGFDGTAAATFKLADVMGHLARIENEALTAIGDELCAKTVAVS